MKFSRRTLLWLLGLAPLFRVRLVEASDSGSDQPMPRDELVVVRGWVLRRDDLRRLAAR